MCKICAYLTMSPLDNFLNGSRRDFFSFFLFFLHHEKVQHTCRNVFCFFVWLWSCHTSNHPQGDLDTFDNSHKSKKIIKILLYPGYLLELCVETWWLFKKIGKIIKWNIWQFSFKKTAPNAKKFPPKKERKENLPASPIPLPRCIPKDHWFQQVFFKGYN